MNSSNTQRLKPAALSEWGSEGRRWEKGERKEEVETVKEGRKLCVGLPVGYRFSFPPIVPA